MCRGRQGQGLAISKLLVDGNQHISSRAMWEEGD